MNEPTNDYMNDALDAALATPSALAAWHAHQSGDDVTTSDWMILDDDTAGWASRRLAKATERIAEINAWADREIQRIKDVAVGQARQHHNDVEFFTAHLTAYLRALNANGKARRTLDLPGGRLSLRKRRPTLRIDDETAFVAYLHSLDASSLVRVRETIDKVALNRAVTIADDVVVLTATGQILDGVVAEHHDDSVTFTLPNTEEES